MKTLFGVVFILFGVFCSIVAFFTGMLWFDMAVGMEVTVISAVLQQQYFLTAGIASALGLGFVGVGAVMLDN